MARRPDGEPWGASMTRHAAPLAGSEALRASGRLLHVLILAGNRRGARLASLPQVLGLPPAAVPIDAHGSIADLWVRRLAGARRGADIGIAIGTEDEAPFYERLGGAAEGALGFRLWTDRQIHRGAAGTVRDYFRDVAAGPADAASGVLVIEGSVFTKLDLPPILEELSRSPAGSIVITTRAGVSCGVMYVDRAAIERIPDVGYFDLKEQLIPALARAGSAARPLYVESDALRLSDRETYLRAVEMRAAEGAVMVADSAEVDPTAELDGVNLLGPSCKVAAGALLSGSIVLNGATVGEGAVVARSVIPPGVRVPRGANVVDQVLSPLGAGGRGA